MALTKGWWWAVVAAMAIVPGAAAEADFAEDDERWSAALDLETLDVPLAAPTLPNPVTLALDSADAAGLALGAHDAHGFALAAAPKLPVLWFPGLLDEHGLHPGWALAFEEDTAGDARVAQAMAEDLARRTAGGTGLDAGPSDPGLRRLPHMAIALDATDLRLATGLEVPEADAAAQPLRIPRVEGLAGLAAHEGVPGTAAVGIAGTAVAPDAGAGLARPASAGAGTGATGAAPLAAASAGPASAAPEGLAVAAGLVATGLLLGGLALYHLVNRNNIFENDVRMQVYDIVARNPGVTIQEVARVVGLSHPTARYHLNVLAKNDLVVFLDKGNKMMFFRNRNEFSEQEREVVAILRNPEATRVYDCIEASPWILRKELSERLGISRTSVNWHLRNLMRAGLVAETREQGKGFLFVRREGRETMLRVLPRMAREPLAAPVPAPAPAPVGEVRGQPA